MYSIFKESICIGEQKYWEFVFVHSRIRDEEIDLLNQRVDDLLKKYSASDIKGVISKLQGIEDISKIYKDVFDTKRKGNGLLNNISIILMHCPVYVFEDAFIMNNDENFTHICYLKESYLHKKMLCSSLTILTGDVKLNDDLKQMILPYVQNKLKNSCGILQVPHHGSYQNWNAWKKLRIKSNVYVIPFGLGNSYGHPHANTIEEITATTSRVQLVNQTQDFEYYIK